MNNELQQRITRIQEICGAWGLYEPGNSSAIKQALKATSEIGELADAVLKNDIDEIKDAIGDIFVCWVNCIKSAQLYGNSPYGLDIDEPWNGRPFYANNCEENVLSLRSDYPDYYKLETIAKWHDLTLLECIDAAIEVISKRKGKISNGAFVKDE